MLSLVGSGAATVMTEQWLRIGLWLGVAADLSWPVYHWAEHWAGGRTETLQQQPTRAAAALPWLQWSRHWQSLRWWIPRETRHQPHQINWTERIFLGSEIMIFTMFSEFTSRAAHHTVLYCCKCFTESEWYIASLWQFHLICLNIRKGEIQWERKGNLCLLGSQYWKFTKL